MTKARIGNKEFDFSWDNTFHNAKWNGEKIEIQPSEKKVIFVLNTKIKPTEGSGLLFIQNQIQLLSKSTIPNSASP